MAARLLVGAFLVVIGLVLVARPQIVDWVSEQTNLRAAKWWAKAGYDKSLRDYDRRLRILRLAAPALFLIVGIVVFLQGAGVLD